MLLGQDSAQEMLTLFASMVCPSPFNKHRPYERVSGKFESDRDMTFPLIYFVQQFRRDRPPWGNIDCFGDFICAKALWRILHPLSVIVARIQDFNERLGPES